MLRRSIAVFGLVTALSWLNHQVVVAHAALRLAYPLEGATLGDTPTVVQLSFWEKPEPSLSVIRVLDRDGASYQIGPASPVAGDPLSLTVPVRPSTVVFTSSTGASFLPWMGMRPVGSTPLACSNHLRERQQRPRLPYPASSRIEILARWLFIVGLVGLLGAAAAGVAQFGGTRELMVGAGAMAAVRRRPSPAGRRPAAHCGHLLRRSVEHINRARARLARRCDRCCRPLDSFWRDGLGRDCVAWRWRAWLSRRWRRWRCTSPPVMLPPVDGRKRRLSAHRWCTSPRWASGSAGWLHCWSVFAEPLRPPRPLPCAVSRQSRQPVSSSSQGRELYGRSTSSRRGIS